VTGAECTAVELMVWCGFCWAAPGTACTDEGQHLARYLRADRRGLIDRDAMTAVCRAVPQVSAGHIVADGFVAVNEPIGHAPAPLGPGAGAERLSVRPDRRPSATPG
jgi:hypothetical protein